LDALNKLHIHSLADVKYLIIDMDGVLYRGDEPMPRLCELFAFLRERPISFILATNNSTRTPQEYADKLARMGVRISPTEVLTSGRATARILAREYPAGTRVHILGEHSLKEAISQEGFVIADEDVAVVVASMDRAVTYEKLKRATLLIRGGARFVATNLDPTQPTEEGLVPGTGSLIAALQMASGVKPMVIGKPEPTMFHLAMAQMGARPETTATIGDRLDTDILGGQRAGLITICVLSGATRRAEAEAFGPDYIFEDIADLLEIWRSLPSRSVAR
jgi:4-nitrophenyl phosphatase